jgi:putative oxidoreductase
MSTEIDSKCCRYGLGDAGLLLIRLMVGFVFIFHGSQKLFGVFGGSGLQGFSGFLESLKIPFPYLSAVLAGCAEFFGGLALFTGVGLRLLAAPLALTMLVASFTAHAGKFSLQEGGMEYALTLGVVVIGLALTGPGRWTLLSLFRKNGPIA